jgi:hypothetical protein
MRWPSAEEVAGAPSVSAGLRKVMHGAKNACLSTEGSARRKDCSRGLEERQVEI